MPYRILADGVVILHFLWIIFLVFGGFWGRKNRMVGYIHIPGVFFACIVELCGWYCPLTHLEVWFRERQHPGFGYSGSFIVHYLEEIIYITLPRWGVIVLTILLLAVNGILYSRGITGQRSVK